MLLKKSRNAECKIMFSEVFRKCTFSALGFKSNQMRQELWKINCVVLDPQSFWAGGKFQGYLSHPSTQSTDRWGKETSSPVGVFFLPCISFLLSVSMLGSLLVLHTFHCKQTIGWWVLLHGFSIPSELPSNVAVAPPSSDDVCLEEKSNYNIVSR